MNQLKSIIDSLARSEAADRAYAAIAGRWGVVGVTIALALSILVGALVFGYDVAGIQEWFAGLNNG